jgi:hypothetical protein
VHAVGVKGRETNLRRFLSTQIEHNFPTEMLYDQFTATMCRGQHEHHRREHAGHFLGVAVIDEEAAGVVDEKLIEIGRDRLVNAEAESRLGDEFG